MGMLFFCTLAIAQAPLRQKQVFQFGSWYKLDNERVIDTTIVLNPPLKYSFDINTNSIKINSTEDFLSVWVSYRVLPDVLFGEIRSKNYQYYDSLDLGIDYAHQGKSSKRMSSPLLSTDQIYKSGSLVRGVSFGNQQNLFVNSNMDLYLEGDLTKDLKISASITDRNIPFEPEGNTQRLQDFDNVSVRVFNDNLSITAGDILLTSSQPRFLKYTKSIQGVSVDHNVQPRKADVKSNFTTSLSKGKFATAVVQPINGIQGPYKLRGANGERFIIVLSNSEKVFMDGEQLQRGYSQDYVIDYNLGEITFTSSRPITQYSRIRVDYEYSDRNYSRNITTFGQQVGFERATFSYQYFSQSDNSNQPLGFTIDRDNVEGLRNSGDQSNLLQINGIDSIGFNENEIRYERRDTLIDHQSQVYYTVNTDPNKAVYNIIFTEVGVGRGNYVREENTLNRPIYKWVAPQNDGKQGSFAPVRIVPAPQKNSMLHTGFRVMLDSGIAGYTITNMEMAFSNQDLNLYSPIDDEDNKGVAFRTTLTRNINHFVNDYHFNGTLGFERLNKSFTWIDRFRNIDFDRDWGLNTVQDSSVGNDNQYWLQFGLRKNLDNRVSGKFVLRGKGDLINGWQQRWQGSKNIGKLQTQFQTFLMENDAPLSKARWRNLTSELFLKGRWQPGYRLEVEQNSILAPKSDSLITSLMNYRQHTVFIRSDQVTNTQLNLQQSWRKDVFPKDGDLKDSLSTYITQFGIRKDGKANDQFDMKLTYRAQRSLTGFGMNEQYVLGKILWRKEAFDDLLSYQLGYATSEARELRREFVFYQVNTGQGTHVWRDENSDEVQDLNEFYEAVNIDEKNYVKVFAPTDTYIPVFDNRYTWQVNLKPEKVLVESFLSAFSLSMNGDIRNRIEQITGIRRFLPVFDRNQTRLLGTNVFYRSVLFFRRGKKGVNIDIGRQNRLRKDLLANGFETKINRTDFVKVRYNFKRGLLLSSGFELSEKENLSDVFEQKNYAIDQNTIESAVSWSPNPRIRYDVIYKLKNNTNSDSQNASHQVIQLGSQLQSAKGTRLSLNYSINNVQFTGEQNNAIAYELLEALVTGVNSKWSAILSRQITNGLQLMIKYDGRKPGDRRSIHLGTMQLTALF